ncbi:MAG TPA: acyltransferase [Polyangia bacterium]|nr:acyltransferase [Polyangia bacterium]
MRRPDERARVDWSLLGLLRFVMAFVVLCVHGAWFFAGRAPVVDQVKELGGKSAVIAFLVLSGFSIGASVERAESGFYRRRLLRVYPSYIVAIAYTAALEAATGGLVPVARHVFHASGTTALLGNVVFLQTIVVSALGFNYSLWSLAVEVVYYVLAPRLRRLATPLLVAAIAASAICFVLPTRDDRGFAYLLVSKTKILKYFWCWGLGFWLWRERRAWALLAGAAASVALVSASAETAEAFAGVPVAITFVALWASTRVSLRPRASRLCDALGDASYPLYLLHLPTLILGWTLGLRGAALFGLVAVATALDTFAVEWRVRPALGRLLLARRGEPQPRAIG